MDTCQYFEKMYHLTSDTEGWTLPSPDKLFQSNKWDLPELMGMKIHLNKVKGKLNYFPLRRWHKHTATMNPAGSVMKKLRCELELAFITQAWCKFYETVSTFELIPYHSKEVKELHTVHLCEAPGAFVSALNHFLVSNLPEIKWDWMATTLNPHYEGNDPKKAVLDDRLILTTQEHWTYGEDNTGDIMNADNVHHLLNEAKRRGFSDKGTLLLVTADGSIDCQKNPAEQEGAVSTLHLCEAVTAMLLLDKGGSLLLKAFTIFEAESVCLLYLLACSFQSIVAWKPATSKEGNSEMYLVCLNYLGKEMLQPWLDILTARYGKGFDHPLFSLDMLPEGFLSQVMSCATIFLNYQVNAIEKNIRTFGTDWKKSKSPKRPKYHFANAAKIQNSVAEAFLVRYRLNKIPTEAQILPAVNAMSKVSALKWLSDLDDQNGELTFIKKVNEQSHVEKWESLSKALESLTVVKKHYICDPMLFFQSIGVAVCKIPPLDITPNIKDVIVGRPINTVLSSKFCHIWFINLHKQIQQLLNDLNLPCVNESTDHSKADAVEAGINTSTMELSNENSKKTENLIHSKSIGEDRSVELANKSRSEEENYPMLTSDMDCFEAGVETSKRNKIIIQLNTILHNIARKEYETFLWSDKLCSKKLQELIDTLNRVDNGGSLLIQDPFPLFTKFQVGLIYLLGLLFNQLLFIWPNAKEENKVGFSILLNGRNGPCHNQTKIQNQLDEIAILVQDEENKTIPRAILDIIPLNLLFEENFFSCLSYANHLYMEHSAKELMEKCSEKLVIKLKCSC